MRGDIWENRRWRNRCHTGWTRPPAVPFRKEGLHKFGSPLLSEALDTPRPMDGPPSSGRGSGRNGQSKNEWAFGGAFIPSKAPTFAWKCMP